MISVKICAENQVYIHSASSEINNINIVSIVICFCEIWRTPQNLNNPSVRWICDCQLCFLCHMTQKHLMLIINTVNCLKFDVNIMHGTMESMCLYSHFYRHFVVAIGIFDSHTFFYRHISVKFDRHHPMLILCQIIEFAIVFFFFFVSHD